MWGVFYWYELDPLVVVVSIMNDIHYRDILKSRDFYIMVNYVWSYENDKCLFQGDNSPL